jgi:hypothetical protein
VGSTVHGVALLETCTALSCTRFGLRHSSRKCNEILKTLLLYGYAEDCLHRHHCPSSYTASVLHKNPDTLTCKNVDCPGSDHQQHTTAAAIKWRGKLHAYAASCAAGTAASSRLSSSVGSILASTWLGGVCSGAVNPVVSCVHQET